MGQVPTEAAQIMITIIPITGIVMGSILVFFYLLWNYKQKVRMIEKGTYQRTSFDLEAFSLLTGLLTASIGAVLFLFFLIREGTSYSLLGGLIPLAVGVSLLAFYRIRIGASRER